MRALLGRFSVDENNVCQQRRSEHATTMSRRRTKESRVPFSRDGGEHVLMNGVCSWPRHRDEEGIEQPLELLRQNF